MAATAYYNPVRAAVRLAHRIRFAKPPRRWLWRDRVVEAHTKSEARAAFKRLLGFRKRLPAGAIIVEL